MADLLAGEDVLDTSCLYKSIYGRGGQMAERLGRRAINQKVAGSIPGRDK